METAINIGVLSFILFSTIGIVAFFIYLYLTDDRTDSKWRSCWRCSNCKEQMTWNTMMHSHGTCPYCGEHEPGTVVRCDHGSTRINPETGKREYQWKER